MYRNDGYYKLSFIPASICIENVYLGGKKTKTIALKTIRRRKHLIAFSETLQLSD